MSSCCTLPPSDPESISLIRKEASPPTSYCPTCGQKGQLVATQTVQAMLAISLEAIRPGLYYFCRTTDCPVVYFSETGQVFHESHLRERVFQKHPHDYQIFVCYCFRHTPGTIREEWEQTGRSTVVQRITAGIQQGQCACEIRNPQGTCCLGNVSQVVKSIQAEATPALTE